MRLKPRVPGSLTILRRFRESTERLMPTPIAGAWVAVVLARAAAACERLAVPPHARCSPTSTPTVAPPTTSVR